MPGALQQLAKAIPMEAVTAGQISPLARRGAGVLKADRALGPYADARHRQRLDDGGGRVTIQTRVVLFHLLGILKRNSGSIMARRTWLIAIFTFIVVERRCTPSSR